MSARTTHRRIGGTLALAAAALAIGACGESSPPPTAAVGEAPAPGAPASAALGAVIAKLGPADAFEVTAARPYAASSCMLGVVEALEVLVCRFDDGAKADAARASFNGFVQGALRAWSKSLQA